MPSEITRPVRSLDELKFWIGKEYRTFALYIGIVVVKKFFDDRKIYEHFLLYFCAMVICMRSDQCNENYEIAKSMLQDFLQNFKILYGIRYFSSNLHNLCHIVDDVMRFGPLYSISAYPFESNLYQLKRLLRSGNLPLKQAAQRITEKQYSYSIPENLKQTMFSFKLCKKLNNFDEHDRLFLSNNESFRNFLHEQNATVYTEIKFPDFKLNANRNSDKWFMDKNFEITCLKYVIESGIDKTRVLLYGSPLSNKKDYFEYPVKSSQLNIFEAKFNEFREAKYFYIHDIYCKMVEVNYDINTSVFLPLLHTI